MRLATRIAACLVFSWLTISATMAQTGHATVELTTQERLWIASHPKIILGVNLDWAPLILQNPDGSYTGVDGDTVKLLNDMLGTNISFETGKWTEMVEKLKNRQIDGLSSSAIVEERRSYADFTFPYSSYQKFIYVSKDNQARIISDSDLAGKRIAHLAGNLFDKQSIESYPGAVAVGIPNQAGILQAALIGNVDAFVGSFVTEYQFTRDSVTYFKAALPLAKPINLVFSIRNDWPELTAILNKGIAKISLQERMQIKERYVQDIGKRLNAAAVTLTDEEKAWLDKGQTVRIRVSDLPPYMFTKPSISGIAVDTIDLVAKRFGIKIELVPAKSDFKTALADLSGPRDHCDMMLMMTRSPDREKLFSLSGDFVSTPWVIYARKDSPFISGLDGLTGKTVATERSYAIQSKLAESFPTIRQLEVADSEAALQAVATGAADAYVGNLTHATYLIKEKHLDNLMVVAPTPFGNQTYAMATRSDWPQLTSILNKGLNALTQEERNAIIQKWGAMEFHSGVDYKLVWQIVIVAALALLAIAYWNRRLANEVAERKKYEKIIAELAFCDALTGLPNRRSLIDRFSLAQQRSQRYQSYGALLFLDLNKFKLLNDTHGHEVGDTLLIEVARRLRLVTRDIDTVARLGGDEFVVLLDDLGQDESQATANAALITEKINLALAADYTIDQVIHQCSASIGIKLFLGTDKNIDQIIREADSAMYEAKRNKSANQAGTHG